MTSMFLHSDIKVIGLITPGIFKSSTSFRDLVHIEPKPNFSKEKTFLYQHLYYKPLLPSPVHILNHFAL